MDIYRAAHVKQQKSFRHYILVHMSVRKTRQKPRKTLKDLLGKEVKSSFMEISDSEEKSTPSAISGQHCPC